ncbi:MAG: DUF3369 domain-containing protein [Spirochaetales bacterium]|nr:DUF3369 domain-containing protein [Spirochaetales bacterium]
MENDNDELIFFKDDILEKEETVTTPWNILIVDDEKDVHTLTKMVLTGYTFENRPLKIFSTYSGKEAVDFLKENKDIAIILLDVVMETEDAGLRCVKQIRDELNNHETRIILRTGQPGQAPEQQVIVNYDINDYKAKTELTASKLFTTVTASLRSYQYIRTIHQNKVGLENIIAASSFLFELQSFSLFAKGILKQLTSILSLDKDSLYINSSSLSAFKTSDKTTYKILAATGSFAGHESEGIDNVVPESVFNRLIDAATKRESIFTENTYTGYFETKKGEHTLLYLQWQRPLTPVDKDLITIFATNVAAAFENISRNNDIAKSQRNIINRLSEIIEGFSYSETSHIKNVTELSWLLGKKMGLSEKQLSVLKMSCPMHDVGQIYISRDLLNKNGPLTKEEFEEIKKHTEMGHNFFANSDDEIMVAARLISHQHHERWDGSGYPQGLKGIETHIYGRIAGVADVFDALVSKRSYREAFKFNDAVKYIEDQKGIKFDPKIVEIFIESISEIKKTIYQDIL